MREFRLDTVDYTASVRPVHVTTPGNEEHESVIPVKLSGIALSRKILANQPVSRMSKPVWRRKRRSCTAVQRECGIEHHRDDSWPKPTPVRRNHDQEIMRSLHFLAPPDPRDPFPGGFALYISLIFAARFSASAGSSFTWPPDCTESSPQPGSMGAVKHANPPRNTTERNIRRMCISSSLRFEPPPMLDRIPHSKTWT